MLYPAELRGRHWASLQVFAARAQAGMEGTLLTIDTHIDIPWPAERNLADPVHDPFQPSARQVEFSKMVAGGLQAGCFAAYVPQGPRTAEGFAAATARALAMLDAINGYAGTHNGVTARITTSADAIEQAARDGVLAIIPCVENGHSIGEDLGILSRFYARGARYMTLTHNGHNALCDSSNPRRDLHDPEHLHGGLSPLGREAVAEMNRLGMLVDISHVSKQGALQAMQVSRVPVIATHSCARALCDVPRNVDDQVLDALQDTGGVISITAVPYFVKPGGKFDQVSVADYAAHIDYVVNRIGLAHCGIGADFEGGGGVTGWNNAADTPALTAELARRGYGPAQLTALWGGNFLRLLRQAEVVAAGQKLPMPAAL